MTEGLMQRRRLRPELWAPFVVVGVLSAYLASRAALTGAGWSTFVACGAEVCDADATPEELAMVGSGTGYDGKYFYRLSLAPFTSEEVEFGIPFGQAGSYRQQRILYPLLAYLLNGATGISTLVWLPLLAIAGCVLATVAAASLLRQAGSNPWWSLAIGLAPGLAVGTPLNTAEPLAIGLALCGVAVVKSRPWLAATLLTCAVVTRETTLAIAAGVGIVVMHDVLKRRTPAGVWGRLAAALLPLLVFVAWQAWLLGNWGNTSAGSTADRAGTPLLDLARSLLVVDIGNAAGPGQAWLWWVLKVIIVVTIVGAIVGIRSSSSSDEVKIAFVVATGITLLLPGLFTPWQAARATVEAYVLGMLIVVSHPKLEPIGLVAIPALAIILVSA